MTRQRHHSQNKNLKDNTNNKGDKGNHDNTGGKNNIRPHGQQ